MHKPARDHPVRAFCVLAGLGQNPGKNGPHAPHCLRRILDHVQAGSSADPWPVTPALPVRIGQHPESYGGACETAEQAAPALHVIDHIRHFARC